MGAVLTIEVLGDGDRVDEHGRASHQGLLPLAMLVLRTRELRIDPVHDGGAGLRFFFTCATVNAVEPLH